MCFMLELPNKKILEMLYNGKQSVIYRAYDRLLGKTVILKLLKEEYPSLTQIANFKHEFELTKDLHSKWPDKIIGVYEILPYQNTFVITLEDFNAISLQIYLNNEPLDLRNFLEVAIKIVEALEAIHSFHVLHRDINPSNILINPKDKHVKLIDFGISTIRSFEPLEPTSINSIEGTLLYISPEQTERMNRVEDYRSDYYSLGISFYEMLTGIVPFKLQDPLKLVHAHIAKKPIKPSTVKSTTPLTLSEIIMKLIAKAPEDRYQSAFGLLEDLRECQSLLASTGSISPFEIAKKDFSPNFQLSEKLYGREAQIESLMNAFEDLKKGFPQLMFITGEAGIGKSRLVHEIYKPLTEQEAYYISGKCDQLKQNIPYHCIVQALHSMVQQIILEGPKEIYKWKGIIQKAVGANGKIITDLIPDLNLIIGNQPELEELGPLESQNRFKSFITMFLQALASNEHPLVLFLDDLQWVDLSTVELISGLFLDKRTTNLFLIGAYRTIDNAPSHPLMHKISEFERADIAMKTLYLSHLDVKEINLLLEDTFRQQNPDTLRLAELCFKKTRGNPFFLNRLLISLYKDGLVWFNLTKRTWTWTLDEIEKRDIANNVIEFMMNKISLLPSQTQRLLQIASYIGNTFNLKLLATIDQLSAKETVLRLDPAIEEGLVIPQDKSYNFIDQMEDYDLDFRFLHDRVQQSALLQISSDEAPKLHYAIGKAWLNYSKETDAEKSLFEAVNHLNQAKDLLISEDKKNWLFDLNASAGSKAKNSSAFKEALEYFKQAYSLLPTDSWTLDYRKTYRFFTEYITCLYLFGEFEEAEKTSTLALQNSKTLEDRVHVIQLQINLYVSKSKFNEAIAICLKQLSELGLTIPLHPSTLALTKEYLYTKWNLGRRNILELIDEKELTDEKQKMIVRLLDSGTAAYYTGNFNLTGMLIFKIVNIVLREGICKEAVQSFMSYAIMLVTTGNLKKAEEFGRLAVELSHKYKDPSIEAKMSGVYGLMIRIWSHHWDTLRPFFQASIEKGLQAGDLTATIVGAANILLYDPTLSLDSLVKEAPFYTNLLRQTKDFQVMGSFKIQFLSKANLNKRLPDPYFFSDEDFDERTALPKFKESNFYSGMAIYYLYKGFVYYHYNELYKARECFQEVSQIERSIYGTPYWIDFTLYSFLNEAALYPAMRLFEKHKSWRRLQTKYKQMKQWAKHCPENFSHYQLLMEAEIARITKKTLSAVYLYDQAIKASKGNRYLNAQALCNELAGKFYINSGLENNARTYFHEARYCYHQWGAHAKVKHIEDSHPLFFSPLQEAAFIKDYTSTTSEKTSSQLLDFLSVMKASQVISREIQLPKLVEKMMEVVVENAGADKGVLLLKNKDRLVVEALASGGKIEVCPDTSVDIPQSILKAAELTKKPIVLADATLSDVYKADPYIITHQPRSLLCIPFFNLGEMKGILYLENSLAKGAFTQDRLDLLEMLSTQIAISIDNARFYGELEEKVKERTQQLQDTQALLIQKEKMAYLGMLITGISHEIKNPLNFIINFSKFSLHHLQDVQQMLKHNHSENNLNKSEIIDSISQIEESVQAILNQGAKADAIVNRMIDHSSFASQQLILTDIHQLVEHSINMSYLRKKQHLLDYQAEILREFDPSIRFVYVYEADLQRVLINLLDNAYDATYKKKIDAKTQDYTPTITVKITNTGDTFEIRVKDNGEGISPELTNKIFTPFFTTKSPGKGVGLGLSLCHNIITKEHNGSLSFQTQAGQFAEFIISLPIERLKN